MLFRQSEWQAKHLFNMHFWTVYAPIGSSVK